MTAAKRNFDTLANASIERTNKDVDEHIGAMYAEFRDVFDENSTLTPEQTINFADRLRILLMQVKNGGAAQLMLPTGATAESTAPATPASTPSSPLGVSAEAARIREVEDSIAEFVKNNDGTVIQSTDGKIDVEASLGSAQKKIEGKSAKEIADAKAETQQVKDDAEKATKVIPTDVVSKAAISQHIEKFKELAFTTNAKDGGFHPSSFPFNKEIVIDEWRYEQAMKEFDAIETLVTPAGTAS